MIGPPPSENRHVIPRWLPWIIVFGCAALAGAFAWEHQALERERAAVLSEESQISGAAAQSVANRLEALQIIARRQMDQRLAARPPAPDAAEAILTPPDLAWDPSSPAIAFALWDPGSHRCQLYVFGGLPLDTDTDYQVWVSGAPGTRVARCAVVHDVEDDRPVRFELHLEPGSQILLTRGPKGGTATLEEAQAHGSIVLASPPYSGKILIQ